VSPWKRGKKVSPTTPEQELLAQVDVQVLHTEGCPHAPATLDLIRDVAAQMGMQIRLRKTLVESAEQADETRFLGSPTVQVNGLDIDPAARRSVSYGLT
jgi:hypothetical protein